MPRVAARTRLPSIHKTSAKSKSPWSTPAVAPLRPRDLITQDFALIHGPWRPAELFLSLLQEGSGTGWGEDGSDTRPNIRIKFFIETTKPRVEPSDFFEDLPTYTLKVTFEPGLYIKPVTVILDSYSVGDIDAPGAPLWLRDVPLTGRTRYREFVRRYTWVHLFIQALLGMPDFSIPHLESWLELLAPVEHIKNLYDAAQRPRATKRIRPRPARRAVDVLVGALERMNLTEGMGGVEELTQQLKDVHM